MKVVIIDSNNKSWYKYNIGEVFEVSIEQVHIGQGYYEQTYSLGDGRCISMSDAEEVTEQHYINKINEFKAKLIEAEEELKLFRKG